MCFPSLHRSTASFCLPDITIDNETVCKNENKMKSLEIHLFNLNFFRKFYVLYYFYFIVKFCVAIKVDLK